MSRFRTGSQKSRVLAAASALDTMAPLSPPESCQTEPQTSFRTDSAGAAGGHRLLPRRSHQGMSRKSERAVRETEPARTIAPPNGRAPGSVAESLDSGSDLGCRRRRRTDRGRANYQTDCRIRVLPGLFGLQPFETVAATRLAAKALTRHTLHRRLATAAW
jgi:hypothetical protein